jgi:hypothetical protein
MGTKDVHLEFLDVTEELIKLVIASESAKLFKTESIKWAVTPEVSPACNAIVHSIDRYRTYQIDP